MSEFSASVASDSRGSLLRLRGKLEYEAIVDFERAGQELLAAKPARVVVDASELVFLNSAGIGALVKLHRGLEQAGGELRVAALRPEILHMLKLCFFDRLLKIFATADEAFA